MIYAIIIMAVVLGVVLRSRWAARLTAVLIITATAYLSLMRMTAQFARPEMNPCGDNELRAAYVQGARDAWARAEPSSAAIWLGMLGVVILALIPKRERNGGTPGATPPNR